VSAPKLSAFPKCYLDDIALGRMELPTWIDMSVDLEPEGLELYSGWLKDTSPAALARIRRQAEGHGLPLPMMCHSPDFTEPDPRARQAQVDRQIEMIRATAELGGSYCRTLSGQRRPELGISEGIDRVVGCIEACLPEAERCGICLVIENHYKDSFWRYPEFAQSMEVFLPLIERIGSPWFGVQFDPSNSVVAGEDPIELLQAVKQRVMTMHASDRHLADGHSLDELALADGETGYAEILQHGVTGQGMNDYDAIFAILREIGFSGWISIEDGMNGLDEMRQSMDFLREKRQEYFGV